VAVFEHLLGRLDLEFFWKALLVHMDSYLNGNRRLRTIYKTLVDSVNAIRVNALKNPSVMD